MQKRGAADRCTVFWLYRTQIKYHFLLFEMVCCICATDIQNCIYFMNYTTCIQFYYLTAILNKHSIHNNRICKRI